MEADFLDAHERHWNDAEILFTAQRYANADHLYGMAAECGLKGLMSCFGMATDPVGTPTDSHDRKHADDIWIRFETYRSGKFEAVDYVLPPENPFDDWNISHRYAHQSHFNQRGVHRHQAGAAVVCQLINKAKLDGLVL